MDTKKRRGSKVSLRAYPYRQALALPPSKDKQLQACPRRIISYSHHDTTNPMLIYTKIVNPLTEFTH